MDSLRKGIVSQLCTNMTFLPQGLIAGLTHAETVSVVEEQQDLQLLPTALQLASYVTMDKSYNLFELHFLHQWNGGNKSYSMLMKIKLGHFPKVLRNYFLGMLIRTWWLCMWIRVAWAGKGPRSNDFQNHGLNKVSYCFYKSTTFPAYYRI